MYIMYKNIYKYIYIKVVYLNYKKIVSKFNLILVYYKYFSIS